jgi:serine protease
MDDALYNAWERGGKTAQNIEATAVESKKMVTNNHVLINTISLNANELTTLKLNFNFLTEQLTDKSKYIYHIIQRDVATNEIVSAVSFEINKEPRPVFEAIADDIEKDRNEVITISAEQISEPALYNWYDTDGNLIYQGKDLTVATQVAQKYKLEVIATADGFKDYTEVEVKLKPSILSFIAPNPATDVVTIGYKINEGGTAYLMILGGYGTTSASNNYILDNTISEKTINLTNYSSGFYTVTLVVNGKIVDAKTLVKQ